MNWFLKSILTALFVLSTFALLKSVIQSSENSAPQTWTISTGASLPMTFAHADHSEQNCLNCHHNYQDNTGQGLCLDCHRTRISTRTLIRQQFHQLCMGCHTRLTKNGGKSGPLRNCLGCHAPDKRP